MILDRIMLKKHSENEHNHTIGTIEAGEVLPAALRSVTTVVGNKQGGAQPLSIKVVISFESLPFFPSGSAFIAFRARGVDALPTPSMFAAIAAEVSFKPLPLFDASGKTSFIMGRMRREKRSRTPVFSATFIIPDHKHINAIRENAVVTALPAPLIAAEVNVSVFPLINENMTDITIRQPENFTANCDPPSKNVKRFLKKLKSIDNYGIIW